MILGAVAAIGQLNIKRLMAYSSIGHMGYALAGIATGQGYSIVTLWVDSSGSMTPSNVQASLDLFLCKISLFSKNQVADNQNKKYCIFYKFHITLSG